MDQAKVVGSDIRVGKFKRLAAVVAVIGAGSAAVALAQAPGDDPEGRRALQDSCRSLAASPQDIAGQRCAAALKSGELSGVDYGPAEP